MSIEMMRELQKQRQRTKGVSLEAKGVGDAVEDALAHEDDDGDNGLESTFTSQVDSGEVDPNMLRYIEQQMNGSEGVDSSAGGSGAARPALDPEEAALYTTPAHLVGVVPGGASSRAVEESAQRWLAGIVEVSLGTEAKMATIEETERAKREMMAKRVSAAEFKQRDREREHQLEIPTNYNSNFHGHKREQFLAKQSQGFGAVAPGASGGGRAGGGRDMPSDASALGRFKTNESKRRH